MIVLGVDPGIAYTGYAFVEHAVNRMEAKEFGAILTPSDMPLEQRLVFLHERLDDFIKKYKPKAMAIEKVYFNQNTSSAMLVGQARGVCILTAGLNSIPVHEYTPQRVKLAVTGYGKADKQQVARMVQRLLRLTTVPKPDDVTDALAIAIAHTGNSMLSKYLTAQG